MPRNGRKIPYSLKDRHTTGFYDDTLSFEEQVALSHARDMKGIDEEIALLRVKVRSLADDPKKVGQYLKSMQMLVKAVDASERASKKSKDDLAEAVNNVAEHVAALMGDPPPPPNPDTPSSQPGAPSS